MNCCLNQPILTNPFGPASHIEYNTFVKASIKYVLQHFTAQNPKLNVLKKVNVFFSNGKQIKIQSKLVSSVLLLFVMSFTISINREFRNFVNTHSYPCLFLKKLDKFLLKRP